MENKVARTYLRRADFKQWGLSEGCHGCRYLRTGQGRQQAHSEACWRRIEDLLKGDPVGSARLAAADERINRALADAVERHATKDPGVRCTLKSASVVCHPESESQKKIAMYTEQDPIPHPSVSNEALDGPFEKTMRIANVENSALNWVSISSAGALDMTHCDFSWKSVRGEVRHIIGSSEPDVIIGSDRDQNRRCRKKDKDHVAFLCELYEAQVARGRYFVQELTSEVNS